MNFGRYMNTTSVMLTFEDDFVNLTMITDCKQKQAEQSIAAISQTGELDCAMITV